MSLDDRTGHVIVSGLHGVGLHGVGLHGVGLRVVELPRAAGDPSG